jgi:NAD(P)-dependent dehydrogenase (short-subunit alcohol dehydrogenase family)
MDLELKGKRALVTGSTAGIGFATARLLAAEGAAVVINGRRPERVDAAIRSIRESVPDADVRGVAADLSTATRCSELIAAVPDVDILVNNLGVYSLRPFEDIGDGEWFRLFETNVMSGVRLSRAYLPGMRGRNWGRIVFISSESGLQIPAEMIHYGMTKTAQLAIARGLAETTLGSGVTVNSILPGPTSTEAVSSFVARRAESEGVDEATIERDFFTTIRPTSILQRFTTPEEVAAMVVYVCSSLASATNGASLRADGGVVRAIA